MNELGEKCVHCGACLWNYATASPENPERMAAAIRAGMGGLHSIGTAKGFGC